MADQPLPPAARPSRSRNPVERIIVWSLISALMLLLAVELHAKRGYDASLNNLQAALKTAESTDTPLTYDHVGDHLSGWCLCSTAPLGTREVVTYRWPSCFKRYVLSLTYRVNSGKVFGVVSENAPPAEAPQMPEGWTPDWLPPELRAAAWERWTAQGKPGAPAESKPVVEMVAEDSSGLVPPDRPELDAP